MPSSSDAVPVIITRRVSRPPTEVSALLFEDPAALLRAPEEPVKLPAGRPTVSVEVRFADFSFRRIAVVGFGPIVMEDDGTQRLPLWWEAADQPWLFPTFDGGLEVRPSDPGTELRLEGRYRPPLGTAGALLNRAVLHRSATASLETLLDRLSAQLLTRTA